jgi:biopolymer transport protein ExbD
MRHRQRFRDEPEINFIPLIDVLLVILIFLMVTTTYSRYAELQINLPTAEAPKPPERLDQIEVAIDAKGLYTINRQPVSAPTREGLAGDIKRAAAGMKDPVIVITADANATHQSVVRVM